MKRFLALLCFCASLTTVALADSPAGNGSGQGPTQINGSSGLMIPQGCDQWKTITLSTSANNQIVLAHSGTNRIFICMFHYSSTAANSISLLTGTQTTNPCDTSAVTQWAAEPVGAGAMNNFGNELALFNGAAGADLCAGPVSNGSIQVTIWYASHA